MSSVASELLVPAGEILGPVLVASSATGSVRAQVVGDLLPGGLGYGRVRGPADVRVPEAVDAPLDVEEDPRVDVHRLGRRAVSPNDVVDLVGDLFDTELARARCRGVLRQLRADTHDLIDRVGTGAPAATAWTGGDLDGDIRVDPHVPTHRNRAAEPRKGRVAAAGRDLLALEVVDRARLLALRLSAFGTRRLGALGCGGRGLPGSGLGAAGGGPCAAGADDAWSALSMRATAALSALRCNANTRATVGPSAVWSGAAAVRLGSATAACSARTAPVGCPTTLAKHSADPAVKRRGLAHLRTSTKRHAPRASVENVNSRWMSALRHSSVCHRALIPEMLRTCHENA